MKQQPKSIETIDQLVQIQIQKRHATLKMAAVLTCSAKPPQILLMIGKLALVSLSMISAPKEILKTL